MNTETITRVVPVEASAETIDRMVQFAMRVSLSGNYSWTDYMRDLYATAIAAPPPPSQQADARDCLDVFNRAARDLPEGYEIVISLEPGSASVSLLYPGGGSHDCYMDESTVEQQVDEGIRAAIDRAQESGNG